MRGRKGWRDGGGELISTATRNQRKRRRDEVNEKRRGWRQKAEVVGLTERKKKEQGVGESHCGKGRETEKQRAAKRQRMERENWGGGER